METDAPVTDIAELVNAWLKNVGLRFNPFLYLESAADPHLLQYTVIHEGLARVWEPGDALIFAPVGGGKTALRLYATWNSLRSLYTFFAIPYVLPAHWDTLPPSDFAAHGRALMVAAARTVLTIFLTFPQRFLRLSIAAQRDLSALLRTMLPDLDWTMAQWQEGPWEVALANLLPPALRGGFLSPAWQQLDAVSGRLADQAPAANNLPPLSALQELFNILHNHFGYQSIHILVDGVDAYFETNRKNGERTGRYWLGRWLTGFRQHFRAPIYTKVFVPEMLHPDFTAHEMESAWPVARLQWTPNMLTEMIRQRLYVASQGRFDSLDALADIGLDDLDRRLAQMASPATPRETLWLVNNLFIAHCRIHKNHNLLEERDVRHLNAIYHNAKTNANHSGGNDNREFSRNKSRF